MKKNNKGFTLMEMLIVVAIIGVLVAIMIPTVANNLNKAKQAKDAANVRAAYAEASAEFLLNGSATAKEVKCEADCDDTLVIGGMVAEGSAAATADTSLPTYEPWSANDTVLVNFGDDGGSIEVDD